MLIFIKIWSLNSSKISQNPLTFYDIRSNTIIQYISLLNLVKVFDQRHISLQQHLMRHEHDTANRALCPNPMRLYIAENSRKTRTFYKKGFSINNPLVLKCNPKSNYMYLNPIDS